MEAAISELQRPFLSEEQIASSRTIMGLDTQLIDDGTYFVVLPDVRSPAAAAGAGARRSTAATHRPAGTPRCSIPARDPARVRAMYTHPWFTPAGASAG